jgi:hypothetical protein
MRGGVIDNTAKDAAVFGLEIPEPSEPDHFEVEPEAWPAVVAFLRCQTQWRSGSNGLIGLDYAALDWTFRLHAVADPAAMLADIQIIEAEILSAVHEKGG